MSNMHERSSNTNCPYVMLTNYCGNENGLGVSSVAPVYLPYGSKVGVQNVPVFTGVSYQQPAYLNNLHRPTGPPTSNSYTYVNDAYRATDNKGNSLKTPCTRYVEVTPDQQVNDTCAISGRCVTSQMVSNRR